MDEMMNKVNTVFTMLQKLEIQPTEHNLKILVVANQYLREVYEKMKTMQQEAAEAQAPEAGKEEADG